MLVNVTEYHTPGASYELGDALKHYGVPGMKHYVHKFGKWQKQAKYANGMANPTAISSNVDHRKDEHPDIPAGTTFYRVSAKENDMGDGKPLYVTYQDRDRQWYKGPASAWIASKSNANQLVEQTFQSKEPLKVASYNQVMTCMEHLYKTDKAFKIELGESLAAWYQGYSSRKSFFKYEDKEVIEKDVREVLHSLDKEQKAFFSSNLANLGDQPTNKSKVIDYLQNQGFNSMTDVYGVNNRSAVSGRGYEGEDPLIVFDSSIFTEPLATPITSRDYKKASKASKKYEKPISKEFITARSVK